jgi:hypothetical protein
MSKREWGLGVLFVLFRVVRVDRSSSPKTNRRSTKLHETGGSQRFHTVSVVRDRSVLFYSSKLFDGSGATKQPRILMIC